MKNILLIVLLILPFEILFAQEEISNELNEKLSAQEVKKMAIFPGCEKVNENNKEKLITCLSEQIGELVMKKMDFFTSKMENIGLTKALAKVQFVISKEGKITEIEPLKGGNVILNKDLEKAFYEISNEIAPIIPALSENGQICDVVFQLPIKFQITSSKINDFKWKEMTVATIKDETQEFEIRIDKKQKMKLYQISNGNAVFLGNYNSSDEIFKAEPYQSILRKNDNKVLVAEKQIGKIDYKIIYSSDEVGWVEVFRTIDGIEELFEVLPQSNLMYSKVYLQVVLKN